MTDHHGLSGAYAVDALDDLERVRFERHLDECPDCQVEVASLRETAARLADTVSLAPPPALRDRVLADIGQVRPLPPIVPAPVESSPRSRPWFRALVAAVVAAIVGIGVTVTQPWDQPEQGLTAAEQVLAADDAQRISVDLPDGARATVVRSVAESRAVLLTEDMPPPPDGKVYELWLQSPEDAEMVPAGLMPEGADEMVLEGDAASATAAGITVEPEGGSEEPSTPPIAYFDFSEAT